MQISSLFSYLAALVFLCCEYDHLVLPFWKLFLLLLNYYSVSVEYHQSSLTFQSPHCHFRVNSGISLWFKIEEEEAEILPYWVLLNYELPIWCLEIKNIWYSLFERLESVFFKCSWLDLFTSCYLVNVVWIIFVRLKRWIFLLLCKKTEYPFALHVKEIVWYEKILN